MSPVRRLMIKPYAAAMLGLALVAASGQDTGSGLGSWKAGAAGSRFRGGAHMGALMGDGRVLLIDGQIDGQAEVFDPVKGAWSPAAPPLTPRRAAAAAPLPNGEVLIVGGISFSEEVALGTAETFNPKTGRWTPAGAIEPGRFGHSAISLENGDVLVTGGQLRGHGPYLADAWLFEHSTRRWSKAGAMAQGRTSHSAVQLRDGNVLVTGGRFVPHGFALREASILNLNKRNWTVSPRLMLSERAEHTSTLMPDGNVLVVGGTKVPGGPQKGSQLASTSELYLTKSQRFVAGPRPTATRQGHATVLLSNGDVLVAGGQMLRPDPAGPERPALGETSLSGDLLLSSKQRWAKTGVLPSDPGGPATSTLLDRKPCGTNCGKVLLVGSGNQPFLYTPVQPRPAALPKREFPVLPITAGAVLALAVLGATVFIRRR